MTIEKSGRRMTLRELLTQAEKATRDLMEKYRTTLAGRLYEVRDLSRPVRRRSQYPTMNSVQNALRKLEEADAEARVMRERLNEYLQEICERARKQ